jgi:DNA-binding XRE family transcriptional regulator
MAELLTARQRWAKVLKAGRRECNLTRPQLACQLGISEATVKAIETGYRAPSPELLDRLVRHLMIDPYDLFFDEELH